MGQREMGTTPTMAEDKMPSRVGQLTRAGPGVPALYWIIPAGIAVLIGVAGIFGYRAIRDSFRQDLTSELQTLLDADKEALRIWVESQCRMAETLAARPVETLEAESRRLGFEGFAMLDPSGRIVVSNNLGTVGTRLPPQTVALLGTVLDGKPRLMPPFSFEGAAIMLVAAPVSQAAGQGAGALAFRIPIARDFTRILSIARLGETGETYAFDREGRLLSESRFEGHLRAAGLLSPGVKSTLNIEIRDPGGNTVEGYRSDLPLKARPLTKMAASAVTGGKGVDIEGYRDYRGVPVVGAWEWFPDFDFAVTHEVDVAEAYHPLHLVNVAFWTLFGAAALSALLLSFGSVLMNRMHRRVSHAKQLGQYTLVEKIGEGAMGKVYRASHAMLRRPTAIKLLDTREPGALERFEREVQLTSQLSHPNTIAIYDFGRTPEGVFYYAMEFVDGIDLADLIKMEGPISPGRVIHILRQVCGSLSEAHAQGLVHRDIKPSNIMLTIRGGEPDVVKVLDFGLVKRVENSKSTMLTTMGVVFGTPGFIPPETLRDPRTFDARGDLYAVGAVAYELLSGQALFDRTTIYEMCRLHVEVTPSVPSVRRGQPLPADMEALVMRALTKDPAARPQTANEFRRLLDGCGAAGSWTQADARTWWDRRAEAIAARKREQRAGSAEPERTLVRSPNLS